jgi:hypothetical protein
MRKNKVTRLRAAGQMLEQALASQAREDGLGDEGAVAAPEVRVSAEEPAEHSIGGLVDRLDRGEGGRCPIDLRRDEISHERAG